MKNRALKIAAAVLCSLFTIQPALITSASSVVRNSRFECEDAEVFDKNGRKISTPKLADKDASGKAVAGTVMRLFDRPDALETIRQRYPAVKIMAITHDEAMKARFSQSIEIVKTEEGSKVIY